MPVTVKLSRMFYERFGEDVTNELVDWMNSMDTAYRNEFRDLFEAHFGRFEARLQQGMGEVRGEVRADVARLETRMAEFKGELETKIEAQGSRFIMWSFGFWLGNVAVVLGVLKLANVL